MPDTCPCPSMPPCSLPTCLLPLYPWGWDGFYGSYADIPVDLLQCHPCLPAPPAQPALGWDGSSFPSPGLLILPSLLPSLPQIRLGPSYTCLVLAPPLCANCCSPSPFPWRRNCSAMPSSFPCPHFVPGCLHGDLLPYLCPCLPMCVLLPPHPYLPAFLPTFVPSSATCHPTFPLPFCLPLVEGRWWWDGTG